MNRLEFIGQTHQGTLVSIDDIIKFFDHTIAAYEIVGNVDGVKVSGIPDDIHSSLIIKVDYLDDKNKAKDVVSYISNELHNQKNLYGRTFKVDARDGKDTSVELVVQEILH